MILCKAEFRLSLKRILLLLVKLWLYWRKREDSNLRYGYPYAAFRVRSIQPLWHASTVLLYRKKTYESRVNTGNNRHSMSEGYGKVTILTYEIFEY